VSEPRVTVRTLEIPDDELPEGCVPGDPNSPGWRALIERLAQGGPIRVITTTDDGAEVAVDLPPPSARQ